MPISCDLELLPLHAEADGTLALCLGVFPSYCCPSPFGSTNLECIQQPKVVLQRAGARPWTLRTYLHIPVQPNEKRERIPNEPRLVKLKRF